MKYTLTLMLLLMVASSVLYLGDMNSMAMLDYEEMVRVISRGVSEAAGVKDVAKELFTFGEAADFVANLPVK